MADKHLTELPWKTLTTKQKLKDPGLGKALADFGKCDDKNPELGLKALDAVEKHAETLKKGKPGEEVSGYLVEMLKEVDKRRKGLELLKKTAGKAEPEEETKEDEEESGVDLKGKLIGAFKKVKLRKPKDPPMEALVCKAGKQFAVLFALKVGTTQKSTLQELLKGETGHKFVKGTCEWGEMDIYTFILESLPSGAAKGLKVFLKEQTGINYKIKVQDTAGAAEEDVTETEVTDTKSVTGDPAALFKKRFENILPLVKNAVVTAGPAGLDIKLKASEAGVFGSKKDWVRANQLLDEADDLLKKVGAFVTPPKPSAEALNAALAEWKSVRSNAIGTLNGLEKQISATILTETTKVLIPKALIQLKSVVANLTAEPNTPQKVSELQRYLEKDDVVIDICKFSQDIRPPLVGVLKQLQTQLAT